MNRLALLSLPFLAVTLLAGCQNPGSAAGTGADDSPAVYSQEPVSQADAAVQFQNEMGDMRRSAIQ